MAVDLSEDPWTRLARFSPPDATPDELQEAADLFAYPPDVYRAAAEIWSWRLAALVVPSAPDPGVSEAVVSSVSQGDISVSYAADAAANPTSLYGVQAAAIQAKIDYLLSRAPSRAATFRGRGRRRVEESRRANPDSIIWVY